MPDPNGKSVLCVSWNPSLARTREELLAQVGYRVISALGEAGAASVCRENADLLVLGHSVPRDKKRAVVESFREHCQAPILSLLRAGQDKLPEADFAVDADNPANFVETVKMILAAK
jgi:DNA-binding response OmpR family regulator